MNDYEKETLDLLITRNTDLQLAKVNWQALRNSISSRISTTSQTRAMSWPILIKIAAVIAIANAIAVTLLLNQFKQRTITTASVEFSTSRVQAIVQIIDSHSQSEVIFDTPTTKSNTARCEVELIDRGSSVNEPIGSPSWIIICKNCPSQIQNGTSEEIKSLLCLF